MTASFAILCVLFAFSAFFSASETALFSLQHKDRVWLREHGTVSAAHVLELLERPRALLVAVLFGNLLVNFLLFAVAAGIVSRLQARADAPEGAGLVVAGGVATTLAVLVFGEITPKAIAVSAPRRVALLSASALLGFRNATRLLTLPLTALVAWVLRNAEARLPPPKGALTDQELKRFVEIQGEVGAMERQASVFLAQALELGSRRVHEVMTPRVDLIATSEDAGEEEFLALVREHRFGKLLVHRGDLDRIYGYIRSKDLLRGTHRNLKELIRPLWFVPSTKSLESLLREMLERNEQIALVVGEYGGTDGLVTLEDVVEEITGDIARADALPLLRPGEAGSWCMSGRFPLREAGELLGISFEPGPSTLSGFVAQRLGRLPEVGDEVVYKRIQFRVEGVERRRASEVVVALPRTLARAPRLDEVPEEMTKSGALRAHRRLEQWVRGTQPEEEESV